MANEEKHKALGQMWLKRNWYESSNGHVETYDDLELTASKNGLAVILTRSKGTRNFIKFDSDDFKRTKIKISVADLVKLIEKNGTRLKG